MVERRGKTSVKECFPLLFPSLVVTVDPTSNACYNILTDIKGGRHMQISSRFTIAIHIFACIDTFENEYKLTSDFIAGSVNVNPVVIRRILQQLKAAGLVTVARGSGGVSAAKPMDEITLLDIFNAVDCIEDNQLFHFHENPNTDCPVGRNIHHSLDSKLNIIQSSLEQSMKNITVADVVKDTQTYIASEQR